MDDTSKQRACRLAAQLVIAEHLAEDEGAGHAGGRLRMAISAAAGNAYSLARSLGVADEEIQSEAEALREHKAYQ